VFVLPRLHRSTFWFCYSCCSTLRLLPHYRVRALLLLFVTLPCSTFGAIRAITVTGTAFLRYRCSAFAVDWPVITLHLENSRFHDLSALPFDRSALRLHFTVEHSFWFCSALFVTTTYCWFFCRYPVYCVDYIAMHFLVMSTEYHPVPFLRFPRCWLPGLECWPPLRSILFLMIFWWRSVLRVNSALGQTFKFCVAIDLHCWLTVVVPYRLFPLILNSALLDCCYLEGDHSTFWLVLLRAPDRYLPPFSEAHSIPLWLPVMTMPFVIHLLQFSTVMLLEQIVREEQDFLTLCYSLECYLGMHLFWKNHWYSHLTPFIVVTVADSDCSDGAFILYIVHFLLLTVTLQWYCVWWHFLTRVCIRLTTSISNFSYCWYSDCYSLHYSVVVFCILIWLTVLFWLWHFLMHCTVVIIIQIFYGIYIVVFVDLPHILPLTVARVTVDVQVREGCYIPIVEWPQAVF